LDGLEKSYKNLKVLKGISFAVQKSSIFALLGPNGAGKTTTIKILNGFPFMISAQIWTRRIKRLQSGGGS